VPSENYQYIERGVNQLLFIDHPYVDEQINAIDSGERGEPKLGLPIKAKKFNDDGNKRAGFPNSGLVIRYKNTLVPVDPFGVDFAEDRYVWLPTPTPNNPHPEIRLHEYSPLTDPCIDLQEGQLMMLTDPRAFRFGLRARLILALCMNSPSNAWSDQSFHDLGRTLHAAIATQPGASEAGIDEDSYDPDNNFTGTYYDPKDSRPYYQAVRGLMRKGLVEAFSAQLDGSDSWDYRIQLTPLALQGAQGCHQIEIHKDYSKLLLPKPPAVNVQIQPETIVVTGSNPSPASNINGITELRHYAEGIEYDNDSEQWPRAVNMGLVMAELTDQLKHDYPDRVKNCLNFLYADDCVQIYTYAEQFVDKGTAAVLKAGHLMSGGALWQNTIAMMDAIAAPVDRMHVVEQVRRFVGEIVKYLMDGGSGLRPKGDRTA
jgi:hypothetical protein